MNSKELLEQAEERAGSIKSISDDIRKIEKAFEWAKTGIVGILNCGEYIWLRNIMGDDGSEDVARIIRANLIGLKNGKVSELEQLLGIQPTPENPKLAKGTILITGHGRSIPHLLPPNTPEVVFPGERKPATINPEFEAAVQDMMQSSKKDDKPKHPEMTIESVKELYHDKDMTLDAVAKVFGTNRTALYKFITKNNLRKPSKKDKSDKQPEETERPS